MRMKFGPARVTACLLPFVPLLDLYQLPFIINGFSTLVSVFVTGLIIIGKKDKYTVRIYTNNRFILGNFITIFLFFLSMLVNINYGFTYRKMIFFIIIIIIFYGVYEGKVDIDYCIKIYLRLSFISSWYVLMQVIFMYLLDIYLPANILPFSTIEIFRAKEAFFSTGIFRPTSFFSEPARFSQYVLPALCIILFDKKYKRKQIIFGLLISFAIIATTSSLGIILITVAWLIFFYFISYRHAFRAVILLFGFVFIAIIIYTTNDFVRDSLHKIFFSIGVNNAKTSERIFRGFSIYTKLPTLNQIIGVGLGNSEYYMTKYNITTIYDSPWYTTYEYFNNFASALIFGGIFAGISFFMTISSLLKSENRSVRVMAILLILLSFGSSMFYDATFLFYGVIMLCCSMQKKYHLN